MESTSSEQKVNIAERDTEAEPAQPLVPVEAENQKSNATPITTSSEDEGHSEKKTLVDFQNPYKHIVASVFCIAMYVFDVGSDIWLAVDYLLTGHIRWGAWTCTFILLAPLVVFIGLLYFDGILAALTAPIRPIVLGVRTIRLDSEIIFHKPAYRDKMRMLLEVVHSDSKKSFCRLIEVIFESIPELYLQSYILCDCNSHEDACGVLQLVSIGTALISISFTPVLFRRNEKLTLGQFDAPELRWSHSFLRVFSTFLMVSARVACIALITSAFNYYVLMVILPHVLAFFILVGVNAGHNKRALVNVIASLFVTASAFLGLDVFTTIEMEDDKLLPGSLRCHFWCYHSLIVAGNGAMITTWYLMAERSRPPMYILIILVTIAVATLLGFLVDLITRCIFFPAMVYKNESKTPELSKSEQDNTV